MKDFLIAKWLNKGSASSDCAFTVDHLRIESSNRKRNYKGISRIPMLMTIRGHLKAQSQKSATRSFKGGFRS